MGEILASRKGLQQNPLALLVSILALSSAVIHIIIAPAHFQEWWGYGVLFLAIALLQAAYGLGFLVREGRFAMSPWYLIGGILGTLLVMEMYVVGRTILSVPLLIPSVAFEPIPPLDVLSKFIELGLVGALAAMLVRLPSFKPSFETTAKLVTVWVLGMSVALVSTGVFTSQPALSSPSATAPTEAPGSEIKQVSVPEGTFPNWRGLLIPLTRTNYSPTRPDGDAKTLISGQLTYAPVFLYQMDGKLPPVSSLARPSIIFFMVEVDHEHLTAIPPQPPQTFLSVDGGERVKPYSVSLLDGGADGIHRMTQLLFPLPSGLDPATIDQENHILTMYMPLGSKLNVDSTYEWRFPIERPAVGAEPGIQFTPAPGVGDASINLDVPGLTKLLTRNLDAVGGNEDMRIEATFATSEYFDKAMSEKAKSRYLPNKFIVFLLAEKTHKTDVPASPPDVSLSLDGQTYKPDMFEEFISAPHHRVTVVRFPVEPPQGLFHRLMELHVPGNPNLDWHFPLRLIGDPTAAGGFKLTPGLVIALLGGMLAAMWPCLFQLTVFFIPALGGLSMEDANSGSVALKRRMSVVKAAFFFVLGFTIVYTAAGGLIGLAAQRLGETPNFNVWQRYIGIVSGVVIIFLALRVAAKVRAPLVCKMPVLSKMAHNRRAANPLEMMLAGLAFATGCMTCFGAALVVVMVVYVGLSGSALLGATTLFVFSLGMGIPLMIAAIAMAKVLPLLFRLEKIIPWMGLASSILMVGFAILLISGNYMVLTRWIFRVLSL